MSNSTPLAWARHLPADAIREMLLELSTVAGHAFGGDPQAVLGELDTVLAAWRSTAEIHADPQLYAALTTPIEPGDLVDAPRPEAYDLDVPAYPTTDAEYAALPVLNLADFHAQESK